MKNLFTLLCLLTLTFGFAQKESRKIELSENFETKVTAISYAVASVKELEEIDWKGIKEIFSSNNEDEEIELSFAIDLKSKNKLKAKFSVSGETKNIDTLIKNSKKGIKGLVKIANKYSKK